jgi:hypothetical protein
VHELLAQAHVQVPVEQRRVESAAAAHSERFLGSPTLRQWSRHRSGRRGAHRVRLKCRRYPTEQGLRGAPTDERVLDALQLPGRPAG